MSLGSLFRKIIRRRCEYNFLFRPKTSASGPNFASICNHHILNTPNLLECIKIFGPKPYCFFHSVSDPRDTADLRKYAEQPIALQVQNVLKDHKTSSVEEIERALHQSKLVVTKDLILDVLKRNRSDWKLAYAFFKWVCREGADSICVGVYNKVIDILGKMHRFEDADQVFDEMSKREGFVNEETYKVMLHRLAADDKLKEMISLFFRRKEFGIEDDSVAFQLLLMFLCKYKHVEVAETLFNSKKEEFGFDIKTLNIILNGWCILGNVDEAKRVWKDIVSSNHKPDVFTFAPFIKVLTKKGKLGVALNLFQEMLDKGFYPDVVICNCVIGALCSKKRISKALAVFKEMNERGVHLNVATYNSLIRILCKIRRMEKVYEFLDEMEERGRSCVPNNITFSYLLKALKGPEEVPGVFERMERNGCKMSIDTYNVVLKLYMDWDHEDKVKSTWDEMEKSGLGPDRCSYTIMIHGLYGKRKYEDAMDFFNEMKLKGMVPEKKTKFLVNRIHIKISEPPKLSFNKRKDMVPELRAKISEPGTKISEPRTKIPEPRTKILVNHINIKSMRGRRQVVGSKLPKVETLTLFKKL